MKITQDKVVELDYKLVVNGETIDQSEPGDPLIYLHGHGGIIPGLERALEGRGVTDNFSVTVQPEDGYGVRDEENIDELGREAFDDDIEVGSTYYAQDEDGGVVPFTVLGIDGDTVKVDFNPPLAGEVLNFDVTVLSVRDATPEELEHGHAHSAGMHDHDEEADVLTIDAAEVGEPETAATGDTMTMKIAADKVVELDYKLTVNGETVDQSEPGEPLTYLHGHSNIIPGLEQAIEGRSAGETLQVTVQPEDGYGPRDEDNMDELDRADFEDDIEVGMTYYAQAEDGSVLPFTVLSLDGDTVKVDFNPPLAGEVLNFEVTVLSVRDATTEELEHGHAHSAGMHDHE